MKRIRHTYDERTIDLNKRREMNAIKFVSKIITNLVNPIWLAMIFESLAEVISDTELCNFSDDNTLFMIAKTLAEVIAKLNSEIQDTLYWFKINSFQLCFWVDLNLQYIIFQNRTYICSLPCVLCRRSVFDTHSVLRFAWQMNVPSPRSTYVM